jgi:hypothetical protein
MKRPITTLLSISAVAAGAWLLWRQASPSSITHPQSSIHDPRSAASNPKSPILTPIVAALLSKESMTLADRLNLLPSLGNKLPAADRKALIDSIGNTPPNGLSPADWHSLANDILQTLRNQQPFTPEYTDRLIALWHDKTLDSTLRDYALQQLREWVSDGDTRTVHEERPEKISLIQQTFLDACTPGHADCDPQSTTIGTALLALDEWASSSSPNLQSQISNLLLSHSGDASNHRGVRATALQLCARRKIKETLPIARSILADTSSPAILSLSAVSLLGSMGTPEDAALLQRLHDQNSRDPMLQASLQKALLSLGDQAASSK